jgi:hypothetical protein
VSAEGIGIARDPDTEVSTEGRFFAVAVAGAINISWATAYDAPRFRELTQLWKRETAALSSSTQKAMHPAYQEIIGMGERALPLIFAEMTREPDHWFWALRAITRENPVPQENQGNLRAMTWDWLAWGKRHGHI